MFASMYVKGLLAVALNAKSFLEVVIHCRKNLLPHKLSAFLLVYSAILSYLYELLLLIKT